MKLPRFQFRLRTLMIGVTLLALACWVTAEHARLIRERDEAVQREAYERRILDATHFELEEVASRFNDMKRQWEAREDAKKSK